MKEGSGEAGLTPGRGRGVVSGVRRSRSMHPIVWHPSARWAGQPGLLGKDISGEGGPKYFHIDENTGLP